MKVRLDIKPLSVNKCWQGRRFKTKDYKDYEVKMLNLLPDITVPAGDLEIFIKFGFSNKTCDWDNPVKPLQDILQKKYLFNDKQVHKATVEKEFVKKGEEFIEFLIKEIE